MSDVFRLPPKPIWHMAKGTQELPGGYYFWDMKKEWCFGPYLIESEAIAGNAKYQALVEKAKEAVSK